MGTVSIIVIGVVAITVVAVLGDMISKIAQARAKGREAVGGSSQAEIQSLQTRVASLEARLEERDEGVRKLQEEVRFVSRMLEDKSSGRPGL